MKKSVISLIVILFIGAIIALYFVPVFQHVRNRVWDFISLTTPEKELQQSDQDHLKQLTLENIRLTGELAEYVQLRKQLSAPAFESFTSIPAQIIGRPVSTLQSQYIINKGIADGVAEGSAVLVNGSALLGFTTTLSAHSAVVETLLSPNTSITGETVPTDSEQPPAKGLITSNFQTSISLGTIPRDTEAKEGQSVVTSSNGEQIPYGMVIGTIATINKPDNEAYQQAGIMLPYNIDSITAVTVLRQP